MTTSTKSLLCTVSIPLKGHFSFSRTVYKWAKSESQLTNGPESVGICSKYNHTARHFSVSSLSAVLLWSRNEHSRFFKSGFFNNRSEFSLKKIKTAFWSKERLLIPINYLNLSLLVIYSHIKWHYRNLQLSIKNLSYCKTLKVIMCA